MSTRELIVHSLLWALLVGIVALAVLMPLIVWKAHGFPHLFWEVAFSFILLCFLLRNQMPKPPAAPWNLPLVWFAVALAVSISGALASPALNAWLRSS